ncbi:hypothetical protein B0H14DRAFT_2631617 [Mycena olivaceomarginata]|nr:hypothetical protein B0H14DRAFT_2631617 [Mycena olivaceomarginata]
MNFSSKASSLESFADVAPHIFQLVVMLFVAFAAAVPTEVSKREINQGPLQGDRVVTLSLKCLRETGSARIRRVRVELCEWYFKNILLQSLNNGTLIQSAHKIHQDGNCEREPAFNGRD